MKVIICIDNKNGFFFGNKRQSQDIFQREDVKHLVGDSILTMKPYSFSLYQDMDMNIQIEEDLWSVENSDYVLVEDEDITEHLSLIDTIIVYNWNRTYPSTRTMTIDLDKLYEKRNESEFKGFSHEKITRTIYQRRGGK